MFDKITDQSRFLNGTPTKRRKLNQGQSLDNEECQLGFGLTRKKSLIDCFHFIGAINRKDSCKLPLLRKKSTNKIPFGLAQFNQIEPKFNENDRKMLDPYKMDIQNFKSDSSSMSSQNDEPKEIKLIKRVTMMNSTNMSNIGMIPKLFRCNSGIDIQESINEADQRKYGDNIYLQQISGISRKNTTNSKENNRKLANRSTSQNFKNNYNRKTYQQDSEEENERDIQQRLLKDYQISSNIQGYVKNHQNYLCMNKLERIFYYIKKINFSKQYEQDDIFQLCQQQIKLYNRDDQGHMLRFYQSWEEEDCVYLVFQTASTSIQEKLQGKIKLRQNQAWSLLTDCCAALSWMKKLSQYHLNIKPGNLLKCRQKYKLSDPFVSMSILSKALSIFKQDQYQEQKLKFAFAYSAPQLLEFRSFIQGLQFDKCDIFSLGICLLENMTGISINILKRDLKIIKKNSQKYLRGYSPALRNLLIKMVSSNPSSRPTSQQIESIRKLQALEGQQKKIAKKTLRSMSI